jgi:hypothetical protein
MTNHDNLVDDILTHDGREILEDELSSPVFSNLAEIDAHLPAFSRRGTLIYLILKDMSSSSWSLNYFFVYHRSSIRACPWRRSVRCGSGSQTH